MRREKEGTKAQYVLTIRINDRSKTASTVITTVVKKSRTGKDKINDKILRQEDKWNDRKRQVW